MRSCSCNQDPLVRYDSGLYSAGFCIPEDKKIKFAQLRKQILLRESTITLKSLQRLMWKCNSFSLPATKFYIRVMAT